LFRKANRIRRSGVCANYLVGRHANEWLQ